VSWWPIVDRVASRVRMIVPDWRGHGGSDKPAAGYDVTDYARDLDGLLCVYNLDHPLLVCHSLGGMIALRWAADHPDRARRIVLEDVPMRNLPNPDARFNDWIALASLSLDQAAAHYAAQYPDWTQEECLRRAESITSTAVPVFQELLIRSRAEPDADRIAESVGIQSPVLLVHGDVSAGGMVPQVDADRFAATLPHATAVRILGGSHSLHRDQSSEFLDAVMPFLLS
jgi:pimeloyl-ACP methyl ester carboxylesterase